MLALSILTLISSIVGLSFGLIPCESPSSHVGSWVASDYAKSLGIGQECAALVQNNCHRQPDNRQMGLTSSWRRGINIKQNCNSIPTLTAIATFLGPNGGYDEPHLHQHTAIFVRCEADGIRVWDQWNGTPIAFRIIPWTGSSPQYSGNNFYTIAD